MSKFIDYFENLEKKHLIMLYLSIVLLGVIVVNLFIPDLMDQKESLQTSIDSKQMKIMQNTTKKLNIDLKRAHNDLLNQDKKSDTEKEQTNRFMSKLYSIGFVFFRENELAKSLDAILKESLKEHIELNFIKNDNLKVSNLTKLVQYKKSMIIDGTGRYKNILRFIHFIEQGNLVMNIHDVKLEEDLKAQNIHFSLIVDFYGVGL
jgi:competence protein ComGC